MPTSSEPLAPWRSPLARALHRNRSLLYSRYLQLATVTPDGLPACRTVVFRGFREGTNQLQVITDRRSQKIQHIAHQPKAEVCWYFPKTREQFRLAGHLLVVDKDNCDPNLQAARSHLWQTISDAARSQFASPPPDQPWEPNQPVIPASPDTLMPLDTFCLVLLLPDRVDHLELRGNPQTRHHYTYDPHNGWAALAINP